MTESRPCDEPQRSQRQGQHLRPRISVVPLMRRPWRKVPVTVVLVWANLLVFVAMVWWGKSVFHFPAETTLLWGANFGPATQHGQWWRLFSAMFVHVGLLHLLVNLWALWDIGRLVEGMLGWWRYGLLFVASGLAGNLVSLALQGQQRVSSGASGAIFGLYGALIALLWVAREDLDMEEFRWLFLAAISFSAVMLGLGAFIPGIDNAAHGGGFLAGAVLASLLRPAAATSAVLRVLGLVWLCLGAVFTAWSSLKPPTYRYADELAARSAIHHFLAEDQLISARWRDLLQPDSPLSFEEIAGALRTEVAAPYERSFAALGRAGSQSALPSTTALLQVQAYAEHRHTEALLAIAALSNAQSGQPATRASPQRSSEVSSPR